jgi:hypothetical protein
MLSLSMGASQALQQSFRDPSSPYYLAPGQTGPAEPDGWLENTHHAGGETTPTAVEEAAAYMTKHGYDPLTLWDQRICWGDHDSFRFL